MALVCDVYVDFVTFPFVVLGHVWYLIESISDPCCLSNFDTLELMVGETLVTLYVQPLFFLRFVLSFLKFSLIFMNMDIR